jgi:hypothetical protein
MAFHPRRPNLSSQSPCQPSLGAWRLGARRFVPNRRTHRARWRTRVIPAGLAGGCHPLLARRGLAFASSRHENLKPDVTHRFALLTVDGRTRTRTLDPLIKSQVVMHQAQWVECKTSQKAPLQINRIPANCKMLPAPADHGRVGLPLDLKPAELLANLWRSRLR